MNRFLYSVVSCGSLFSDSAYKTERIIYFYMWKDIEGYEGLYQVSDCNEWVKSLYDWWYMHNKFREKNLKDDIRDWYRRVSLYKNKIKNRILLHRLVAIVFIPNPDNLPIVLHLDNNPLNCNKDNLKWWTHADNIIQCHLEWRANNHLQLNHPKCMLWKFWKDNHLSKAVVQYTKNMEYITSFWWISEAERETWVSNSHISRCCRWIEKTAWGFIWRYL